jgi:vacuolar protein sorting-associated protein IST1
MRDEEQVDNAKPAKTKGFSLRTKGQVKAHEKRSFPVTTTKTDQESYDQQSPKSTSEHKTVTSSSVPQTVKSPDPETPSKERASHVHPNLPDYDDIFARLGALRSTNRR